MTPAWDTFAIYAFSAVKFQVHPVTIGTGTKLFADGAIPFTTNHKAWPRCSAL